MDMDTGTLEPLGDTTGGAFVVGVHFVGAYDRRFARMNPSYIEGRDINFEAIVNGNRNFFSSLDRPAIARCVDALARHLLTRGNCTAQVNSETLCKLLAGVGCSRAATRGVVRTTFAAGTPSGHLSANVARVMTVLCEALDLATSVTGHLPRLRGEPEIDPSRDCEADMAEATASVRAWAAANGAAAPAAAARPNPGIPEDGTPGPGAAGAGAMAPPAAVVPVVTPTAAAAADAPGAEPDGPVVAAPPNAPLLSRPGQGAWACMSSDDMAT